MDSAGHEKRASSGAWKRRLAIALGLAIVLAWAGCVETPSGPRSLTAFEPDRMADLELRMWQAYYRKEKVRLFALLVVSLREQYRYPWSKAAANGFHLARAAARFGDMRGTRSDYDVVLPDLREGYAMTKEWTHASFDVDAVARRELAWWVARRVPEEDSAENVGRLVGEEYVALYGVRDGAAREEIMKAGDLRARAAKLRDQGGDAADWATIGAMLRDSYRVLYAAVQ
jgi:hypothetical protein